MKKQHIIILNGPPNSGKDTLGNLLAKKFRNVALTTFKYDLYKETAKYFKVGLNEFIERASDRILKEQKVSALGMRSPREALIHVSEDIIKPQFGKEYFGNKALDRVREGVPADTIVFTDGGFVDEAKVFLNENYKVTIFHLIGRGTFEGDSREYMDIEHEMATTVDLFIIDNRPDLAIDIISSYIK
jgi:hypothetical protein